MYVQYVLYVLYISAENPPRDQDENRIEAILTARQPSRPSEGSAEEGAHRDEDPILSHPSSSQTDCSRSRDSSRDRSRSKDSSRSRDRSSSRSKDMNPTTV